MLELRTSTAELDLGFELVKIPIARGLQEGSKQSCLFFDLVMGEILRIVDARVNLGLSTNFLRRLSPSQSRVIA